MIKLILMAALLFVSGASVAQKVVVGVKGEAIIDNRAMPAGSITTDKKARITNATATTRGTNDLNNLSSAESNKTVSHYFEVAKTDLNNRAMTHWLPAVNGCANYDDNTWRAPTQRELMLIWTLQVTLINKVSGFSAYTQTYQWSATESYSDNPWAVLMMNAQNHGVVYNSWNKVQLLGIRCVRDLDPQ